MLLAVNSLLYLGALTLAMVATNSMPETATRGARVARWILAFGGGTIITAAMALGFAGMWFESALAGSAAIIVVGTSMWFALAHLANDDDEDDEDGGSLFSPSSPDPTKPEGGPSDDMWDEFDRARAGWERDRRPSLV
jgi:hypothetical protein